MRNLRIYSFCLFLMIGGAIPVTSQQPLTTPSKKAKKAFQEAEKCFTSLDYKCAVQHAEKALTFDERFVEAYLLLGDIYSEMKEYGPAVTSYKKALEVDAAFYPNARLLAARIELGQGLYQEAADDVRLFLQYGPIAPRERAIAEELMKRSDFGLYNIQHPVPFDPINMGQGINSEDNEYINAITLDNSELYLTVSIRTHPEEVYGLWEEDFYVSRSVEGHWSGRIALGPPMNTSENEGALFISPDGRYLLFSGCNQPDGLGSCDIYIAFRNNNTWREPQNLGEPVNTILWETQPCLASDGRTLYFVSTRPGGQGGSDIWCSCYSDKTGWGIPENLGNTVNTPGDEMSPFIHPDNQSLYFASTGHIGMGGYDLFLCRKSEDGSWAAPVNLGYPINTLADEINLLVDAAGLTAYISSDMPGGYGGKDIYQFELYPDIQPLTVTYMKGTVRDSHTGGPLVSDFELIDLETGMTAIESSSDVSTGAFLLALPTNRDYALNVSAYGYAFHSEHIALRGIHTINDPLHVNIALHPIAPDQIVILRNIFFDTDQYVLKPESRIELDKLTEFLIRNPGVRIEIRGHTDQVGTKEYNDQLSQLRAHAVYEYLCERGIDESRLTYQGFGYSIPMATNETEEGRRQNRRTEFRILENH